MENRFFMFVLHYDCILYIILCFFFDVLKYMWFQWTKMFYFKKRLGFGFKKAKCLLSKRSDSNTSCLGSTVPITIVCKSVANKIWRLLLFAQLLDHISSYQWFFSYVTVLKTSFSKPEFTCPCMSEQSIVATLFREGSLYKSLICRLGSVNVQNI